jgi:hypothetical protein
MLAEHVRMEERELFVLVEQALPPSRLAALAAALAQVPPIAKSSPHLIARIPHP